MSRVYRLARHLVEWKKARVVTVVRSDSVYAVDDRAPAVPDGGDELFDLRMGDAVQVADRNRRLRQQAEVEHARKLQEREEAEASRARAADHRRTLANVELEAPSHDRPDMFGHSSEVKEAALADSGSSHALGGAPTRLPDARKETVIEFENDTGRGMVLD